MQVILAALLALFLGIVLLLWGYRAFLVLLPVFGFFAGFWLGAEGTQLIFGEGFLATVTSWVVGIVLGLVCAVLSYVFYAAGVALVAAIIGGGLGSGLVKALGIDSNVIIAAVAIITAVVVAVLVLRFNLQKYVIIALTAIAAANALVLAPLLLFGRVSLDALKLEGSAVRPVLADSWFWLVAWAVLAAVGVYFQLRTNRTYTFHGDRYVEAWG